MWLDQCRDWVKQYDPVTPEMAEPHHYAFMRRLSEGLPANAIIVSDTGGNVIMMGHCFKSKQGQRIFTSNGNTPMGFALCGAIGAWFAEPERPIICIIGDGGMQLNIQELQTIKHYGAKIKMIVLNNKILANTLLYQVQNGKRVLACNSESGYSSPDFVAVARAYGILAGCDFTLEQFLAIDGAALWDVVHENFCDFAPRMALWNAGIEELFPPLPPDEFERNMMIPPLNGWRDRQAQYKELPDAYKG